MQGLALIGLDSKLRDLIDCKKWTRVTFALMEPCDVPGAGDDFRHWNFFDLLQPF